VRYAFWVIALLVVAADQVSKLMVQSMLPLNGRSVPLLPGFLYLTHVENDGVAFGQLSGAGIVLVFAALIAVVVIVRYRMKLLEEHGSLHPLLLVGLALPLGGAIGNMIDRIRLGRVVDFFDIKVWPVFNVADSGITVGAVCLLVYFLFISQPGPHPEVRVSSDELRVGEAEP
jgi:signal peptidase II